MPDAIDALSDLFPDVDLAVRILKLQEECGEAAQAYIGATGANPRKGVTNTYSDVRLELLDVAITALVAYCRAGGTEALTELAYHAQSRVDRATVKAGGS